jgi:sodium transport system permease protein
MLDRIWTITIKETVDNLRDRRSVTNALFSVLFNPILYIFLFGFLNRSLSQQAERPLQLPIVGAENAPNMVQFLDQNNVDILPAPADPETAVREGEVDLVLVIPAEYAEAFGNGRPAPVRLLQDESSRNSGIAVNRAEGLLRAYSLRISSGRLLARGISPALLAAVPVESVDVSPNAQGGGGFALNLLPVIMLTAAFFGGFYLAVDMTAGERERESLEPLLLNPVPRSAIVLGKYLAALAFTILATTLATALFIGLLQIPAIQEFTAIRVRLTLGTVGTAVLLIIPVVIMAVAVEIFIASYARSVKEAQNYVQIVALFGFIPSLFLSVLPVRAQAWMNLIPTVSQLFLINKVARGEALDAVEVMVASGVTLLIGVVAVVAAIRLYSRERILSSNL